ncbi:MAG: MBL fold metallo-hydrolase [Promethearchaeota archaeon]
MTKLNFYGGVNEIGGNKILLEDNDTTVFFDFGFSFSTSKKYYGDFLRPRKSSGLGDYLEFGILPELSGIYRDDYLTKMGREPTTKPNIDGVFLTHAHADHCWDVSFLHKEIPIYCGETCELILKAVQNSSFITGFGMDFYTYLENFVDRRRRPKYKRIFNTFRTGKTIKLNDIEVEPIHVDHSIPGAYGFIIHTSSGCIVYTGDFRLHGTRGDMSRDFIEKAKECKPDVMICEGTRIREKPGLTENDVRKEVSKFIKKTKGLVIANFPGKDTDRLNSFIQACKENNRKLAITTKQAYLLETLEADTGFSVPDLRDETFLIYLHKAGWGIIAEDGYDIKEKEKDYAQWEDKYLSYDNAVTYKDIIKKQKEIVLYCDFYDLHELIDIKPKEGSCFIHSLSEPHDEEQEIDFERMKNWLDHFNLPLLQAHASGHISGEEIRNVVNEIRPKKVIGIHTDDPEGFKTVVGRKSPAKIIIPEYSKSMNVK